MLQLGLNEGMKIADLGAGTGHYAFLAAAAVGPRGRVYAIDVQQEVVRHLRTLARERRVPQLEPVWGDIEKPGGTLLRDRSCDAAIVSNVLFQLPRKRALVEEVRRILMPGGRVLVIDWAGSYAGMGPMAGQVFPEHEAEALFIGEGFHKVKALRAGPHHYGIVFTAPTL